MGTCFLYPGQGAQYPGMAKDLWEASGGVKDLFTLASDRSGMDLKKLLFEGSEEDLKATDKTQIAITLVNLSSKLILEEKGITSDGCAGFSLGEYSALVDGGIISMEDIFPIVKKRGELMETASRNLDNPAGNPGMAAVIGLDFDTLSSIISASGIDGVFLANYNSPTQTVLSGTAEGLDKAENLCKEGGARRYIRLKVSGPFHCPLLQEAKDGMKNFLEGVAFSDPQKPVYTNVTGKKIRSGDEAKQMCLDQIITTVRWVDEEKSIEGDGYDRCIEVGPGTVLSGLWKAFNGEIKCFPAGTMEQIETL